MFLSRTYASRTEIPKGTEQLFKKQGALFIREGRDLNADNPWDAETWNLTEQGQFLSKYGEALANAFAKSAGTIIGGLRPSLRKPPPVQVLVQRRNLTTINNGGGGEGSSGDGPPT